MYGMGQHDMVVEGKLGDMYRDAEREQLAAQVPRTRRQIIGMKAYRYLLSRSAHRLLLSGRQLQKRADDLSRILNTSAEAKTHKA